MLDLKSVSHSTRIRGITVSFENAQCWHLLGANGSGKSSLLCAMAGILDSDGQIRFKSNDIRNMPRDDLAEYRCMLPQQHQLYFEVSVKECFFMLHRSHDIPPLLIESLKLLSLLDKSMFALSGGEMQRVYLALHLTQIWPAIKRGEALVLLDEPTQQLDPFFQTKTLELIDSIVGLGNLVIQSHHDINQTLHFASHVILLKDGQAIDQGSTNCVINQDSMQVVYDQPFMEICEDSSQKRYLVVK
ncbi:MAG: ATP-binding cassette domain-containing protein [Pseudomonadota bacterium]